MLTTTKTISKTRLRQGYGGQALLSSGHRACAGCGQLIAARAVAEALGPNTIIANATGCLEVTTTPYPESAWGMPWIHSLFENPAAIASGISAVLKYKNKSSLVIPAPQDAGGIQERAIKNLSGSPIKSGMTKINVVAQGGDGSTFDIGFGLISGMWERGEDILYICYDNEAYANTGVQASGATPPGARTTTTPPGKENPLGSSFHKKDMIAIALAHGVRYVAQTTAGFLNDITVKIKKAMEIRGPKYIQILVPCIPGWGIDPGQTMKLGKLAAQTGLYPSLEYTDGVLTGAMKLPAPAPAVEDYLKAQNRFSHLAKTMEGKKQIEQLKLIAQENIKKYGL
jgi:pyruvate ferredoxin oxidoreductase beta subunit